MSVSTTNLKMKLLYSFCLLIFIKSVLTDNKLKVSIYYEALCPDSYKFLIREFCPAYKKIGSFLNVHFVPYGRTKQTFEIDEWKFSCQHGPNECLGDRVQACGIELEKGQDANVGFVCCIMSNYHQAASTNHIKSCIHHLNVTMETLLNCTNSPLGTKLILSHGKETQSLNHLHFVPTIILNDKIIDSKNNQKAMLHRFYDTCLKYIDKI